MDEEFLKQLHAEMISAFSDALSIIVAALAKDLDAERLRKALDQQIRASQAMGVSPTATRIALESLASVDAELALRKQDKKH